MFRHLSDLIGKRIQATDGDIGHIRDFNFDDFAWTIRHLVVDTGTWLPGREVLISPVAIQTTSDFKHSVPVNLTRQQIESSPDIGTQLPISRQMELEYFSHYGWPEYWGGLIGTLGPAPLPMRSPVAVEEAVSPNADPATFHLRSSREVTGYHIHASDGLIGHVEDFIFDDQGEWAIRYLVVDTRNWWPGKKVLLSPRWVDAVVWEDREVRVPLPRERIRQAPEYDTSRAIDRAFEERLYNHYGQPKYWL